MERLKRELIGQILSVIRSLDNPCLSDNRIVTYSKELEALAKAYAALEGKNVTLQKRKFT